MIERREYAGRRRGGSTGFLAETIQPKSGVIAGLDPAIHLAKMMDARVKPAHDACTYHHPFAAASTVAISILLMVIIDAIAR
jgi:hypothetical protein